MGVGRKEAFAEESKKQPVWESLVPSPHVTPWTSHLSSCPHWGWGAASTQICREGCPGMSPSPPFPASWPAWGTVCPRMYSPHWSWGVMGYRKMQQEHLRARVQLGPVSPYCPPNPRILWREGAIDKTCPEGISPFSSPFCEEGSWGPKGSGH